MSAPEAPWAALATAGLWLAVLAGPVMGGAALVRSADPPAAPPPPLHLGGFAEIVVAHHLTAPPPAGSPAGSSADTIASPATAVLAPVAAALRPPPPDDRTARPAPAPPRALAAVAHRPAGPDRYGVEVLVLHRDGTLETWQVTVRTTDDRLAAEGLPTLVPTSPPTGAVRLAVGRLAPPDPDDPLAGTVEGFLQALLTGAGDLQRWTSATSVLALRPVPMASVELQRIGVHRLDETTVAVAADVRATRPDGRVEQLQYPLLLTGRAGRWDVVRILPGLPLAPGADGPAPPG